MNTLLKIAAAALLIGIATPAVVGNASAAPAVVEGAATTIDGDTVTVGGYTVRLKGVDAPEPRMLHGEEATAAMRAIVGGWLRCELTGEKTHKREVGFCRNAAGEDIGREIIAQGKALACPRYSKIYVPFEQPDAVQRLTRAAYCLETPSRYVTCSFSGYCLTNNGEWIPPQLKQRDTRDQAVQPPALPRATVGDPR